MVESAAAWSQQGSFAFRPQAVTKSTPNLPSVFNATIRSTLATMANPLRIRDVQEGVLNGQFERA